MPPLATTLLPADCADVLELDDLWSFVRGKANARWLWVALCRRTRQVVAYIIGDRSEKSGQSLWHAISESYRQAHSYSDFWEAYQKVFPKQTHRSIGKDSGQTNHVERWNNMLRQWLARYTRKTLFFSKSE